MANPLREFVDELTGAFSNTLSFEIEEGGDPRAQVDQAIADAGVVAGFVSCVQPFPAADLFILMPLHAKLAVQIGRIKGFEVTQERAGQIVREVMGVAWLALTSQALIGIVGKAVPVVRPILTYPLNYAATWAIGQAVAYYFDCLLEGREPTKAQLREVFAEQLQRGRKQGEDLDPVGVRERATLLRAKIVARDPDLLTSVRLDPRFQYVPRRSFATPPAPTPPPGGGRIKIVIPPKPKPAPPPVPIAARVEDQELFLGEPEPEAAAPEVAEPVPEATEPESSGGEPAPADAEEAPEPARSKSTSARNTRGLVDGLERLAELYEIGALSEEEFRAAKGRLLD
jgi:uncharacterized protein (DUF697 family)